MGMNGGLVFGKVRQGGKPVYKAMVDIKWIKGDLSQDRILVKSDDKRENSPTWVETDKEGKYILPFLWSGTQIGLAVQTARLTISMFAVAFEVVDKYFSGGDTRSKHIEVPGFLCLNLKALVSQGYPTFDNSAGQDALDCAKDFLMAYRKIKAFPPHHKAFLSTEVWAIFAKADFDIPSF